MRYIPTDKELKQKTELVEVTVKGSYIAAIDERRKTARRYTVQVLVPKNFTKSDLKRQTPRVLLEHKEYPDFVMMRTFEQTGKVIKTNKTIKLESLYSDRELNRFKKMRNEIAKDAKAERSGRGNLDKGISGDTSDIDPDTGLPPVINDDGDEE